MNNNVIELFPKKAVEENSKYVEREEVVNLKIALNKGREEFHSLSPAHKYELFDTTASMLEKVLVVNLELAMKLRKINEEFEGEEV